ncbi:MAG: hypothetical protein A2174_00540 [Candidatus Portnoybacteria bacterium RBG_13_41_18]|uniref:Uncharacterized protein n=1 Tax=Candidatus Portnoybacteria bacterium RBG_13_41_18 TaxID=1801991 RepID=A0A1G2FBS2_9BACT|nr:MAG: hypothetical protein A2174_00540 [Candidatus Portnoybacteria bacterium RBG_13_41_18]
MEKVKEEGLQEKPGWDGRWKLACTMLRNPLDKISGEKEDRGFFEVEDMDEKAISPRFTGPNRIFEGIVGIDQFVPPNKMKFLGFSEDLRKQNKKGDGK